MGMSAFGLMILLCLLSVCTLVKSASILESSSDLWQNRLLYENEEIPSQQSSPLSRRITPKSVFVAPAFSQCSDGYRLDEFGNCVKIVRLNEAAQWESVLEKLKQMSAQQFGFNKRQSQRNDSTDGTHISGDPGEKINHKVSNSADSSADNAGPFQLSIPFSSKNSSESQLPPNDTAISSTTEKPREISTTFRPFFIQSTTIDETSISQNTHFVDYATEETTDAQEPTTLGNIDYPDDTEANQYANTESTNMETTVLADSTTEDTVTESVVNVASHFVSESDFDKFLDATEITTQVVKRIPNYSSVVPLKGVVNVANKNVEQIPLAAATNSNPFSNYIAPKPNTVRNASDVNMPKNPTVHIVNSFSNKNEDVDGESTNIPSDIFQKLPPSGERTKPKCDSNNKYDCLLQINIFPTNKPLFLLNRKPSSNAFVRFPETPTKGFVRFPPQKVPIEYDDVALAESNPGYRYWDRHYPSTWWTSWKSKPQFIQIVPETSAIYGVGDMNYIRSHPHFQTQTEWYNK